MWSNWCHSRYERSSPVGDRYDNEKKPTLTLFMDPQDRDDDG
jgi:hypothetical protein